MSKEPVKVGEEGEELKIEGFKVLGKINSGTFGNVYKVVFEEDSKRVMAMKKFKKIYKSEEEAEEEQEVQFFRKIQHTGIIQMERILFEKSTLFIFMELGDLDLCEKIKEMKDDCLFFSEEEIKRHML
jgi:serine/threonine protein kinase